MRVTDETARAELDGVLMASMADDSAAFDLRLMAPFYRVFANTLGNGPWFDTYIQNIPPVPQVGG